MTKLLTNCDIDPHTHRHTDTQTHTHTHTLSHTHKHTHIYIYIYIYLYLYIYTNLPLNAIVRLPHPPSRDSQGPPSSDKQTCNYDIECSNHHPFLSTVRPKGLSCSKMKWGAIYTNLPVNAKVRLPHPRSGDSQDNDFCSGVMVLL